jgi:hypothetical protein
LPSGDVAAEKRNIFVAAMKDWQEGQSCGARASEEVGNGFTLMVFCDAQAYASHQNG